MKNANYSKKVIGFFLLFVVMNAFTQNSARHQRDVPKGYYVIKRNLAECKTRTDSLIYLKANTEVNFEMFKLRKTGFLSGKRVLLDSAGLKFMSIDTSFLTLTPN